MKRNPLQYLSSKEYAHQALLPDNLHLFIDKEAAMNFAKSYMHDTNQSDGNSNFSDSEDGNSIINSDSTYLSPRKVFEHDKKFDLSFEDR